MARRKHRRTTPQPTFDARARAVCRRKERYASEAEARSIALMNAPRGRAAATRPYACAICGGWHLTTRGP